MITIWEGFIQCGLCGGAGKIFREKHERCIECDGLGILKPTFTEKIVYRNQLKDCIFNELQTREKC